MASPDQEQRKRPLNFSELWPDIRRLVGERRGVLLAGLALILISRGAGFVLPASTKYLVDDVITGEKTELLGPLVAAVVAATIVQAITAVSLTQLLSKSAQKLIADIGEDDMPADLTRQ